MKLVDRALNRSKAVVAVWGYIRSTVRVLLWSILAVMVLSALNVPVTSIIAVFSVAGLAVSLALQNTPVQPGQWHRHHGLQALRRR